MCGRYTLTSSDERRLGSRFQISFYEATRSALRRYNVAPTKEVLAVRSGPDLAGGRKAALVRWGLVPDWAKDLRTGYRMINARVEGLLGSRAYSPLVRKQANR